MRQTTPKTPTEREIQDGSRFELDRLLQVTYRPFGLPVRIFADASIKTGQIGLCDPSKGALKIRLPEAREGFGALVMGTVVVIKNHSDSANEIEVLPSGGNTIDGAQSLSLVAARACAILLAVPGGWITI